MRHNIFALMMLLQLPRCANLVVCNAYLCDCNCGSCITSILFCFSMNFHHDVDVVSIKFLKVKLDEQALVADKWFTNMFEFESIIEFERTIDKQLLQQAQVQIIESHIHNYYKSEDGPR